MHDPARQGAADQRFGHSGRLDQGFEIDSGFDPHLMGHEDHILGADVAGSSPVPMPREGTAAQSGDRAIELSYAQLKRDQETGHRGAAGVVQMQADARIGKPVAHI